MNEKTRFSKLRFRVDQVKSGESLDVAFPALCDHREFREYAEHNRDKLIRYIIYLYDPNSDLVDEFENLQDRKDAAATEAGFERDNTGEWPEDVQAIMNLSDRPARKMILRFLKTIHHNVWREITILEQELDLYSAMRLTPLPKGKQDDPTLLAKRDSLMEMCEKRVRSLEILKLKFYANHSDVQEVAEDEMITPENAIEIMKFSQN